jgi:UDP-glucose 4-epimerase
MGSKSPIQHLPDRPGDIKHSQAATDRLLATGFQPSSDLEEGLQATVEYFLEKFAVAG